LQAELSGGALTLLTHPFRTADFLIVQYVQLCCGNSADKLCHLKSVAYLVALTEHRTMVQNTDVDMYKTITLT